MAKDVIYIDVEDDITAIVGKIKASKEKIVALVPPARMGVLQSAINMRLLQRTAEAENKRIVLITNNKSLAMLASAAEIPVAKNLQSKPELAEVPVLKVDGDDIIDGETLPIGELDESAKDNAVDRAVDDITKAEQSDAVKNTTSRQAKVSSQGKSKDPKVPNFPKFRKKLLLIIGAVILFVGFLVWAIWFAPKATVIISAKTTTVTVDKGVTLKLSGAADPEKGILGATKEEESKDVSVEFTATGKKKVGEKAKGSVRIKTDAETILMRGLTVPTGTKITSASGMTYTTTSAAIFAKGDDTAYGGVVVGVIATDVGSNYNGATGAASTGASGVSSVSFVDAPTGGSSKEVTVVSREDVNKATEKLKEEKDSNLKDRVAESVKDRGVVIPESYSEKHSDPTPSVAVGAEANGPVTLKSTLTASMIAVDKTDLQNFIKQSVKEEIGDKEDQKVYSDGVDETQFAQFVDGKNDLAVRITVNATVGPKIEEDKIKEQAKGKTYGDIQSSLESIDGVDDVDTKFWPFWVRKAPNDEKRITIEFDLKDAS